MATSIGMNGKKYKVNFYNEKNKTNKHIGSYESYQEAQEKRSAVEIEFYKNNTEFLPKGVSVSKDLFVLKIKSFLITGKYNDLKTIGSAKTLSEIKDLKIKCLTSIVG